MSVGCLPQCLEARQVAELEQFERRAATRRDVIDLVVEAELGQRSGDIENMLIKVADTYDDDVRLTIDAMVGLIEPVIIIVMGVFVGFLVISILLPILDMSQNL